MNISLIGKTNEIIEIINESTFQFINFSIYNMNLNNRSKKIFFQQSNHLMIYVKERNQCLNIIDEWSKYHNEGTIILRQVYDPLFGDKLYQLLLSRNKNINIVIIPRIEDYNCRQEPKVVLFGEGRPTSFTKDLRKRIAENNKFIIINKLKETTLLYNIYKSYQSLNVRFLSRIQDLSQKIKVDSENLLRGLGQIINIDYRKLRQLEEFEELKSLKLKRNRWIVSLISKVIIITHSSHIVVFGYDEELLKSLNKLEVNSIRVYTCERNRKILSRKIKYYDSPYDSADKGDIIINLSIAEEIQAISLLELADRMNSKIMIDAYNLFELYEMKALNWRYISKGRPSI